MKVSYRKIVQRLEIVSNFQLGKGVNYLEQHRFIRAQISSTTS